jgi:hypothetical protein
MFPKNNFFEPDKNLIFLKFEFYHKKNSFNKSLGLMIDNFFINFSQLILKVMLLFSGFWLTVRCFLVL